MPRVRQSPVWFLAGTWVSEERKYPHRQCCIPKGLSILFPIINCEENPIEYPTRKSKDDMRKSLSRDMATVSKYECFVDGEELSPEIGTFRSQILRYRIT